MRIHWYCSKHLVGRENVKILVIENIAISVRVVSKRSDNHWNNEFKVHRLTWKTSLKDVT